MASQARRMFMPQVGADDPASGKMGSMPRKNIAVSSCDVTAMVQSRLRDSMYISLRSVECQFEDGVLTLTGVVPAFYVKQVALSVLEDLADLGVVRVIDKIEVAIPNRNPRGDAS